MIDSILLSKFSIAKSGVYAPDFTSTGSGGVETYVYNASLLTSLGDLAPAYLSWLDISQAKKLQEVLLGSEIAGY